MREIMRNSSTVGGTYAFKQFSCKNSQFENLNDAHNIDAYVCSLLSLDGTNYFVHEKSRIGVCFSAASSQRSSVRISHGIEAEALIFVVKRRL